MQQRGLRNTKREEGNGRVDSSTNDAVNVHLILVSYYLGKTGHVIAVLAGVLGLLNITGVNGMFYKHYDHVGSVIRKVTLDLKKNSTCR